MLLREFANIGMNDYSVVEVFYIEEFPGSPKRIFCGYYKDFLKKFPRFEEKELWLVNPGSCFDENFLLYSDLPSGYSLYHLFLCPKEVK